MLQMVGATSAGDLDDRRAELQVMRDVFADGMQFPPSDLAELRSLHLPPSHAYCVVKVTPCAPTCLRGPGRVCCNNPVFPAASRLLFIRTCYAAVMLNGLVSEH